MSENDKQLLKAISVFFYNLLTTILAIWFLYDLIIKKDVNYNFYIVCFLYLIANNINNKQ